MARSTTGNLTRLTIFNVYYKKIISKENSRITQSELNWKMLKQAG